MLKKLIRHFKKDPGRCAAVIVAAGSSSRMQGTDKIWASLEGEPLISHTVRVFQESPVIHEIILVAREDVQDQLGTLCQEMGFDKVKIIVAGGDTRAHSVMKGLDHVSKGVKLVAVHDGARPLVTMELVEAAVQGAARYHAAAPAIPVKDTIKSAENRIVTGTPDRSTLFAVQTPRVFDFDLLRGALQQALERTLPVTDDCSAVEALGMSVYLTKGSEENIKVTTPLDLILADAILKRRKEQV